MKNKSLLFIPLAFLISGTTFAQSKSFQTLKEHFGGEENVHSFGVSGFFCRMALGMAGEWEFKEAIEDVNHVRFMVIPQEAFRSQHLTVSGFKKFIRQEGFEELSTVKDKGDLVSIYLQSTGNKKHTYFVLVEESDEVVAIELKGYINPSVLMATDNTLTKM